MATNNCTLGLVDSKEVGHPPWQAEKIKLLISNSLIAPSGNDHQRYLSGKGSRSILLIHKGFVQITAEPSRLLDRDYRDVYMLFKMNGFTHIKATMLKDLITGWTKVKESVEHVSVGGEISFKMDYVAPGSPVIIYVHSFSKDMVEIEGYVDPD